MLNTASRWLLAFLTIASVAQAQVRQSGQVTPGHIGCWTTTGVVQDCGTPASPFVTGGLGIISSNDQTIVIDNATTEGAYNQLGFGVTPNAANITSQAFGGATDLPLNIVAKSINFIIDGATSTGPFIPTSGGVITGSLVINGTLTVGGVPVPGPAGPFLSTAGGTVSGLTTFSGAGVGLAVTNNATIGVTLNLASSPSSPSPLFGFLVNAVNSYAFPPNATGYRSRYWDSEVSTSGTSSGVEESNYFTTRLSGTGTLTNELNVVHPYFENNGSTITGQVEPFESSADNRAGAITKFQNNLSFFLNQAGATMNQTRNYESGFTNNNATPGSIGEYAALNCNPMGGTGAHPTFEYCIRNANPQGAISTVGVVSIGTLDASGSALLQVNGSDHSGTVVFIVKSNIANVMFADTSGVVTVPGSIASGSIHLFGGDNSASTFPLVINNLAGAFPLTVANDGSVLVATATGHLGFYGAGGGTLKQTPVGACAGNSGCQALRDALGGLGLINTGSITN